MATEARKYLMIYRDKKKEWRWKFHGGNHEVIAASSEGFKRFAGLRNNVQLVLGFVIYMPDAVYRRKQKLRLDVPPFMMNRTTLYVSYAK